ncbi:MAG: acyl-CoA dehydrogenase family protein [Bacteroidota bacterium]
MQTSTIADRRAFAAFTSEHIKPYVEVYDREEHLPEELLRNLAAQGYLGATLPEQYGGQGWDQSTYAVLLEEMGKACSSCRSLLTVHLSLVAETILRWGTKEQKAYWLPALARGEKVAAFCLTEAGAGSDAKSLQASYRKVGNQYFITGHKRWTTFGQRADVYLFFAREGDKISAFLVERDRPGLSVQPIKGILGTRATMLGEVRLDNCAIPATHLLGKEGLGFFQIVQTALDNGRFSVALGSLGIARACLEDSVAYVKSRQQFGQYLKAFQLIKQKIANMITDIKAAELLCYNAARMRDEKHPEAVIQTSIAKYHASRTAFQAATEAVQIHGALGCHQELPIQRYFRDAKIMEIIEGSSEIQQVLIADYGITALGTLFE